MTKRSRAFTALTNLAVLVPGLLITETALANGACPGSLTEYGDSAGGFCCTGTVNVDAETCDGSVCALDPNRTEGNPICYEAASTLCRSMGSDNYYGGYAGGFCCSGALGAGNDTCASGSVCALDPTRTQGVPMCTAMQAECPAGQSRYGEWAGGFCCDGTVGEGAATCNGTICALDPTRTQGLVLCPTVMPQCFDGQTRYGEWAGGFCCEGTVAEDGGSCNGTVCALDSTRTQGNPMCSPQGTQGGNTFFWTSPAGGSGLRFFAPSASVVTTANSATISGTITIGLHADDPGITLTNAQIVLGLDGQGYVSTLVGTASVSLPDPGEDGLSWNDLGTVTLGLGLGADLAANYGVVAPMQGDRRYLVLVADAGLSGSYGDVQFSAGSSVSTTIVVDPLDPSVYFRGDLSGITGISALSDVGAGVSAQGLLAFQPAVTWGVEESLGSFDGHIVLEGAGNLGAGTLPLSVDGQVMVRLPTTAGAATEIGVNGTLTANMDLGALTFSLPIGQASAGVQLSSQESHAYFSGVISADSANILPSWVPIQTSGSLKAAGLLSSNVSTSFLKLQGQATLASYDLLNATLTIDSDSIGVTALAVLPGLQIDMTGSFITTGSAAGQGSLTGTVAVNIPFYASKTIDAQTQELVHYADDAAECGWQTVTDASQCGSKAVVEGWDCVTAWLSKCAPNIYCVPSACASQALTCDVQASCDVLETYSFSTTDPNHYWGSFQGTVTVTLDANGTLSGSINGSYCTPDSPAVCVPPVSMRIANFGGEHPQACASVAVPGTSEMCVDL
jgi:hypothetical protein